MDFKISKNTKLQKYLGATAKRYIQMGQASHVPEIKEWNLDETVMRVEQNFQQI